MKILIDTNVIIDVLQKRDPFFVDSHRALRKATEEKIVCLFSVSAVTDVFYLLRRHFKSAEKAKKHIVDLGKLVTFADVESKDVYGALRNPMSDFEDAVVEAVAERIDAEYIMTRNTKDFADSKVPAITPVDFIRL